MEGTKGGRAIISKDNYGSFKCHILKDNYGSYEVVVLYEQLWWFLITTIL